MVEAPTLRLANTTLPTLSAGWGASVGWFCIAWEVGAVAWYILCKFGGFGTFDRLANGDFNFGDFVVLLSMVGAAILPMFVAEVGQISSACRRLEDSIQAYCIDDLRMHRLVGAPVGHGAQESKSWPGFRIRDIWHGGHTASAEHRRNIGVGSHNPDGPDHPSRRGLLQRR
jgi:hypothetical protein